MAKSCIDDGDHLDAKQMINKYYIASALMLLP